MKIELAGRRARILFLGTVLVAGMLLAAYSAKAWLAEHWNASSQPQLWLRAARLEPGYATYWEHLGLYKQWDVGNGDVHAAVRYLRRATEDDPLSADLSMELADAYQAAGDSAHARQAYEKARANQPLSSEVAWRYGSFLLFEGNLPQGYAEIRRAVTEDHSLATSAVSECWQANPSVSAILDDVLPPKADVYRAAMDFFLSQQNLDGAVIVWQRLLALHQPMKLPQAFWLIDSLMNANRVADASAVWRDALAAANWPGARDAGQSLVFNGGFEQDIANGGFGWREIPVDGARYGIDLSVAHSGSRSLRIEFDGTENLNFQNVFQYIPVAPRTHYHFSAFLRTENISTDSGIRFEIVDPHHPSEVQFLTPNMTGTNPWTPVETDFVTGADTDLLEIALRRTPEWRFDNKIQGTVWVDDVAIFPAQAATQAQATGGAR
jgi:tetratricopeptide (TPR) repeat protein